jgi:hypothetical protein
MNDSYSLFCHTCKTRSSVSNFRILIYSLSELSNFRIFDVSGGCGCGCVVVGGAVRVLVWLGVDVGEGVSMCFSGLELRCL